jgi:hypothetical protein
MGPVSDVCCLITDQTHSVAGGRLWWFRQNQGVSLAEKNAASFPRKSAMVYGNLAPARVVAFQAGQTPNARL